MAWIYNAEEDWWWHISDDFDDFGDFDDFDTDNKADD